jgi:hypothetical protein
MKRVLLLWGAIALGGCQVQNPFAAFGPPRVPAPTTAESLPYYPPTATATQRTSPATPAASPRLSVSAEGNSVAQVPRSRFVADPADREPIRIVDNPAAATRTASSAARTAAPAVSPPVQGAQPAGVAPIRSVPAAAPGGAPQSGYAPPGKSPAFNRTRGYFSAQPAAGPSAGGIRSDPAVMPAAYQSAAPTFVETPANGQWRAR